MNSELKKVKEWCDINKLSINLKKTNYMIVKSPRKKNMNVNINITNRDGSYTICFNYFSYTIQIGWNWYCTWVLMCVT